MASEHGVEVFNAGATFLTQTPVDENGLYSGRYQHPRPTVGYKLRRYCVDLDSGEVIELRMSDGQIGSDG